MLRVRSLALMLLVASSSACNKTEGGATPDSPNAAVAGTEQRTATSQARQASATVGSAGARALVAVASTSASEAEPCERTCGRVGDCLSRDAVIGAFEASRLELECLDSCVHTPEGAVRTSFLACESQTSCGPLLDCARNNWQELSQARRGPVVEGIVSASDPCKDGCRWLYTCAYTGMPPSTAYMSPELDEMIRLCEGQCEQLSADSAEREIYAHFAECLPQNCSSADMGNCY